MTLDELFEEIDNDFNINFENLADKIYKVPALHSKYLRLFFNHKSKLNKYNEELNKLYKKSITISLKNMNTNLITLRKSIFISTVTMNTANLA